MMTQSENQGLHKNKIIVNLQVESPKKIKIFEETPKIDLSGSIASIACYLKTELFFNTIQPVILNSYFH